MKTIFDILFFKNYNFYVWNIVIGLFVAELYMLKRKIIATSKVKWVIFAISVFIGIALVLRSSPINTEEEYSVSAVHHDSGCLIENYQEAFSGIDDLYQNTPRFLHYFEDKTLTIASCVDNKDEIIAYFSHYCPKLLVSQDDSYKDKIEKKIFQNVRENTLHLKKDGRLYILDKTWNDSENIVCVQSEKQVFFVSEKLLNDMYLGTYESDYLSEREQTLDDLEYMNRCRGERDINQIVFLFALYLLGVAMSTIFFKGRYKALSAFFGLPMSIALVNCLGIVYVLLGIPLRKISILITLAIWIVLVVFAWKKAGKIVISKKEVGLYLGIPLALITFAVYMKMYTFTGDSLEKTIRGIQIGEYGLTREQMLQCVAIGLLEPIIHGIGWKFHIDFVYAIYSIIPICIFGILFSAVHYLAKNKQFAILISMAGIIFLLSNDDFMSISFFVHINGVMACFILMLIVTMVLDKNVKISHSLIVTILTLSIITARLEGALYICIIFALLAGTGKCGMENAGLNMVAGIEIVAWELILVAGTKFGVDNNAVAWSVENAYIMIAGALVIIALPFVLGWNKGFIWFIKKNYYKIAVVFFAFASIAILFSEQELSLKTAQIMAKHFATSYQSNSGGIWSYALLMVPLLLQNKNKTTGFLGSLVLCYIMSLYILFCMRTGYPIHWDHNDSCRRTLMQIMPTAMFAIAYIAGEYT